MQQAIATLLHHYATVTNGESALFPETLAQISEIHGVAIPEFCDAFALAVAERLIGGELDADGAEFAMDDLLDAADYSLPPFARAVFDLTDCQEAPRKRSPGSCTITWPGGLPDGAYRPQDGADSVF
ncbi:hypothetical protein [Cognatiluteimonas lumbrici]|uniref:hypothetical protein n=1 Tax=Cognatiluteimonas lumbrici TaxID=2559601 RepID=UPI001126067C|nr:hypothetical protein [Luteimonas lumbrici]